MSNKMKFCKYCNRQVRPVQSSDKSSAITNLFRGIFHLFLMVVTCGLYLIAYVIGKGFGSKEMVCPICNARM